MLQQQQKTLRRSLELESQPVFDSRAALYARLNGCQPAVAVAFVAAASGNLLFKDNSVFMEGRYLVHDEI